MKNIIAYSLWGSNPLYLEGAFRNADLVEEQFPGWSIRIYHDNTVPAESIKALNEHPFVETVSVDSMNIKYGMFWRYCIADDKTVDRFLIRDLDDRLNKHDKATVDEWMNTEYPYHIIRSARSHNFLVMGGLWGAKPNDIPFNMGDTVRNFELTAHEADKYRDQRFLGEYIYPHAKGNCLVHGYDFNFNSGEVREFPGSNILGGVYEGHIKTWEDGVRAQRIREMDLPGFENADPDPEFHIKQGEERYVKHCRNN